MLTPSRFTCFLRLVRRQVRAGLIIGSSFGCGFAIANPDGPTVVAGSATINTINNELQISNSPGAIINWNGFSISPAEITRFLQQSDQSAVLNRVTGGALSNIQGQLQSNGRVFVVNPNGIVIGNGARIDTAGFVASTLDISNADFSAGNYRFRGDSGRIVNNGAITSGPDGEVVLIAPSVENNGDIRVQGGEIILAAGREVVLTSLSDANISFRVSAPGDSAVNLGSLIAQNGSVGVFADSVRNTGEISARRVGRDDNGRVVLFGDSTTAVSGAVSSLGSGASGGEIQILGDNIQLTSARLDASGTSGGGRILIGGEFQGSGSLPRARSTTIDASSTVHADAIGQGDGGEVIVWSESSTQTYGLLTARGGSIGGDGGLIETSSRGSLDFGQPADVSAIAGAPGTWLLDPEDIVIDSGRADSISTALNGGSNVQVKTADTGSGEGNITVSAPITKSQGGDASLGLTAHNRIDVNAPITSTAGKLNVSLRAGRDINVNAGISTNGGNYSAAINQALAGAIEPQESGEDVTEEDGDSVIVEESSAESAADPAHAGNDVEPTEQYASDDTDTEDTSAAEVGGVPATVPATSQETGGINLLASIDTAGGSLEADAGANGLLHVETSLNAINAETDGIGGNVRLLGNRVGLFDGATVNASGSAGGGEILIGGDQQGLNPDVRNAEAVYLSSTSSVRADALDRGDGGRIIIYADESASIYGEVSARGGAAGGNGGFIETSGKRSLRITQTPDVSAQIGDGGTWLIDPDQIDIVDSDASFGFTSSESGGNTVFGSDDSTADDTAVISVGLIREALYDGGNVRILTAADDTPSGTGDINWLADLDLNDSRVELSRGGELGDLTLEAANDIVFTGSLFDSNLNDDPTIGDDRVGTLTLLANRNFNGQGDIIFDATGRASTLRIDTRNLISAAGQNFTLVGGATAGVDLDSDQFDVNVMETIAFNPVTPGPRISIDSRGGGSTWTANDLTLNEGSGFNQFRFSGNDRFNEPPVEAGIVTIANNIMIGASNAFTGKGEITTNTLIANGGFLRATTLNLLEGESEINGDRTNSFDFADWNIEEGAVVQWNDGTINVSGATINNRGTFIANSDDRLVSSDEVASNAVFNNFFVFEKRGVDAEDANDSTEIGNRFGNPPMPGFGEEGIFEFNNTGIVRAAAGDLLFFQYGLDVTPQGGFRQQGGDGLTEIGPGTISSIQVRLSRQDPELPGTFFFDGGSITGQPGLPDFAFPDAVINGNVALDNAVVAPGSSPGSLTINGNLDATSNAIFDMELNSTNDEINVQGVADINGAQVNVSFFNGFEPAEDDLFTLINAVGGFSADSAPNVALLDIPPADLEFADFFLPDPPPDATEFVVGFFSATDPETPTGGGTPGGTPPPIVEFGDPVPPPVLTFEPETPLAVLEPLPQSDPASPEPIDSSDEVVTLLDQDPDDEGVDESPEFLQCY